MKSEPEPKAVKSPFQCSDRAIVCVTKEANDYRLFIYKKSMGHTEFGYEILAVMFLKKEANDGVPDA